MKSGVIREGLVGQDGGHGRTALFFVWRQRELNFDPGTKMSYSNTGYLLLGLIVQRVSGQSLARFAAERIFRPLGMRHTRIQGNNYGELIDNRAYSYLTQPGGGFHYAAVSDSVVGAGNVMTTVDDLARWDENFYSGRVGGQNLLQQLEINGKLSDGQPINYGLGLWVAEYRGLKLFEHGGDDQGFHAALLRFPEVHTSVVALCNAGDADPGQLARRVADIVLKSRLGSSSDQAVPKSTLAPTEVRIDKNLLDGYVGDYEIAPGILLAITRVSGALVAQVGSHAEVTVLPSSPTAFFSKTDKLRITFDEPKNGRAWGVNVRQDDDRYARRVASTALTPMQRLSYSGTFYSEELDTIFTVLVRNDKLYLRYPRGELEMAPAGDDAFWAEYPFGLIRFVCTAQRPCHRFLANADGDRLRNVQFVRVDLPAVGSGS